MGEVFHVQLKKSMLVMKEQLQIQILAHYEQMLEHLSQETKEVEWLSEETALNMIQSNEKMII